MSARAHEVISALKKDTLLSLLKRNERLDGRRLDEYRDIDIKVNLVGKAEGSALVHLGGTKVIAGVKISVGKPFPDTPNKGVLIVNAELIPVASPTFEAGPPGEDDVELARVIDRGIRSAPMLDLEKLVLVPGEKVWTVFVDIYTLDHDGNLFDAAGLAATAALLTSKLREAKVEDGELKITDNVVPLPLKSVPVFVTVAKIGNKLLLDPTYEEELVMDARITFAFNEEGEICCIQKGGAGSFSYDEILQAMEMAREAAHKLRARLPPKNGANV